METKTAAFEDEIFDLESLDNETEFKTLIRSIKLSDGFSLLFARANQISDQKQLAESIKNEFPDKKIKIISFDKPIKHLLDKLKENLETEKNDAVLVYGLNSSFPTDSASLKNTFVKNLNASRNSFPRTIDCPVVLLIPDFAITAIMRGAIDFFSIRSGVFYFESQNIAKQSQIQEISSTNYRELGFLTIEERNERIKTIEILLSEEKNLERKINLLIKLGQLNQFAGNFNKAELDFDTALKLWHRTNNLTLSSYILNELALVYKSQGRYDEAIDKLEEILKIDSQTIGKEHPDYAGSLNNLANVYQSQGKYDEAIEKFKEALKIGEQTIGKEHPDYAIGLSNLANVYQSQGKYDEAIEKLEEVLKIDSQTIGKEHPDYAIDLNNLANIYKSQGKYDEAIEKFKEALKIDEQTIGKEHPDYATHLNNLANVYQSQSRYNKALELYKKALSIFEKTLPKNHPHTNQLLESVEQCRELLEESEKKSS